MIEIFAFYFFATISLFCFWVCIFSKNVLNSMTALAGGMVFISGFFFILGAEFLGVVQIIVYAGAVMIMYAFAMMFLDANKDVKESKKNQKLIFSLGFLCAILVVLAVAAPVVSQNLSLEIITKNQSNLQVVGILLFTKYLVAFELVAVMLLVSMICAIVLTHKNMDKSLTLEEENL